MTSYYAQPPPPVGVPPPQGNLYKPSLFTFFPFLRRSISYPMDLTVFPPLKLICYLFSSPLRAFIWPILTILIRLSTARISSEGRLSPARISTAGRLSTCRLSSAGIPASAAVWSGVRSSSSSATSKPKERSWIRRRLVSRLCFCFNVRQLLRSGFRGGEVRIRWGNEVIGWIWSRNFCFVVEECGSDRNR